MSGITQFRADFTAVYARWRDTGEPEQPDDLSVDRRICHRNRLVGQLNLVIQQRLLRGAVSGCRWHQPILKNFLGTRSIGALQRIKVVFAHSYVGAAPRRNVSEKCLPACAVDLRF